MELPIPKKRDDRKIKQARDEYRRKLHELREKTGINIPFGANLDKYHNHENH